MRRDSLLPLMVVAVLAAGCGPAVERLKWTGATPHLKVAGAVNGEKVAIDLSGDPAQDTAQLWCKREYEVPLVNGAPDYANGRISEIKIRTNARFGLDGTDRYAELEFKKHNFQKDAVGTVVKVVPRSDTVNPAAGEMWFEWEWHAPDKTTLFEEAAVSGDLKLEEYTGTPDSTGLIIPDNTGTFGGTLNVKWSETNQISMSFTAKCAKNEIFQIQ